MDIGKNYPFEVKINAPYRRRQPAHLLLQQRPGGRGVKPGPRSSWRPCTSSHRAGRQVSGEHGIGSGKVPYLAESVGEVNMRLMEQIKKVFDPNLILNPGKVCYKL